MKDFMEFLTSKKLFTTSDSKKAGMTKEDIKNNPDIVDLGSFPVRFTNKKGVVFERVEHVYTYNPELAEMVRNVNKLYKKKNRDKEEVRKLVDEINEKVSEILVSAKAEI